MNRPFSHVNDNRLAVAELSESNTMDKIVRDAAQKKMSLQTENSNKNEIIKKISLLDEKKIGKLARLIENLDHIDLNKQKTQQKTKTKSNLKEQKIQAVNKFNINYIQTDNINFGNININLNSTKDFNSSNTKLLTKASEEINSRINSRLESKDLKNKSLKLSDQVLASIKRSRSNSISNDPGMLKLK